MVETKDKIRAVLKERDDLKKKLLRLQEALADEPKQESSDEDAVKEEESATPADSHTDDLNKVVDILEAYGDRLKKVESKFEAMEKPEDKKEAVEEKPEDKKESADEDADDKKEAVEDKPEDKKEAVDDKKPEDKKEAAEEKPEDKKEAVDEKKPEEKKEEVQTNDSKSEASEEPAEGDKKAEEVADDEKDADKKDPQPPIVEKLNFKHAVRVESTFKGTLSEATKKLLKR